MSNTKSLVDFISVKKYLSDHAKDYSSWERNIIEGYMSSSPKVKFTKDVMREIYDELGLIPDNENMYIAFQNLIEEEFGIEGRNITEVGGGIIPRLAKRIHLKQKTGSITVYDPRLTDDIEEDDRFILKRETFNNHTDIGNTDLLVGLMPCQGAEPLIDQAIKNRIDFILWFCEGGPHGDYFDFYESDEEWLDSMMHLAHRGSENQKMGPILVKKFDEYSEYPIIYCHKEK